MSILGKTREVSFVRSEEKQVQDLLEKDLIAVGWFEKNEIRVVRIEPNLFSVGTEKNISFYCDKTGKIFFNIGNIREQFFFPSFLSTAGYSETKNTNGEYKLFRTNTYSPTSDKIKGKEISLYSKEYFSAWEDIVFYKDKFTIDLYKRPDRDNNYHSLTDEKIQDLYKNKTLRIKDLVSFLEHKQISKKAYDIYVKKLVGHIVEQIGDLRLYRTDDVVTLEEIQGYLKKKLITKEMYIFFNKQIQSRDKLLGNTATNKTDTKNTASRNARTLKQEITKK